MEGDNLRVKRDDKCQRQSWSKKERDHSLVDASNELEFDPLLPQLLLLLRHSLLIPTGFNLNPELLHIPLPDSHQHADPVPVEGSDHVLFVSDEVCRRGFETAESHAASPEVCYVKRNLERSGLRPAFTTSVVALLVDDSAVSH